MSRSKALRTLPELLSPRFFKALADPTRVGILLWLAKGRRECTVGEVAAATTVSLSVVSRHLGMLRDVGILEMEKRGKEVHYRVRVTELAGLLRTLAEALEACCPTER